MGNPVHKAMNEANKAMSVREAIDSDDPQLILDMIEGETELNEALAALVDLNIEDEILLEGLKAKIDDLGARKSRVEKTIETRRNVMLMALEKAGIPTVKLPTATLSVGKTAQQAVITDESQIPARFWKSQDPKLDKADLASALRSGEIIPGAELSNGGIKLTVRVK